jgi:formate dehydrogenase major subunit
MEQKVNVNLRIDGQEVVVPEGSTILDAARQNGIHIPTLCDHPDLPPHGGCRLCLVEVDGAPKLVASCVMPVRQGMEVVTSNDRIIESRRTILTFLFSEKPHYCMFCAQSGDCELQQLAYDYQMDHLTVSSLDQDLPVDTSHPDLVLDHNRCVLCGRCIRACREVAGNMVLDFQYRGGQAAVGADLSDQLGHSTCVSCGLCLQVCPTGAIFFRHRTHYAVKGKDKDWQTVDTVCPSCGLLCPTKYVVHDNNLLKIEGHVNGPSLDHGQLCSKGRFAPFRDPGPRLLKTLLRNGRGQSDQVDWDQALNAAAQALKGAAGAQGPKAIFGLISSRRSAEEAAKFQEFMSQALPGARVDTLDGGHFRVNSKVLTNGHHGLDEVDFSLVARADAVLFVGDGYQDSQPLLLSLARLAVFGQGAPLFVAGAANPLGPWASAYLDGGSGALPGLLRKFCELVVRGAVGGSAGEVVCQMAQALTSATNPVLVIGPSLAGGGDTESLKLIVDLVENRRAAGLAWHLLFAKPEGNSAEFWRKGLACGDDWPTTGQYKAAVVVIDGEADPGPVLRPVLENVESLVLMTPYMVPGWTERAQVLIPLPTLLEVEGTFSSLDGKDSKLKARVLSPPAGVRPVDGILASLADRLKS